MSMIPIGTVAAPPLLQIGNSTTPYGGGNSYGTGFDFGKTTWPLLPPDPYEPKTRREWLIGKALRAGAGFQAKEIADYIERELVKEEQCEEVVDAFKEMP